MQGLLQRFIRDHIQELRGAEFKIAVYLYARLDRARCPDMVEMKIADLSTATGVSWKQTQVALQRLNEKSILRVEGGRGRTTCCRLPGAAGPAQSGSASVSQEAGEREAALSGTEPAAADAISLPPALTPSGAAGRESGTGIVEPRPTESNFSNHQKNLTGPKPASPATAATAQPDPDREAIEWIARVGPPPDADYLRKADQMAGGREKLVECLRFTIEKEWSFETGDLLLCHIYDQCHIPHSEFASWLRFSGRQEPRHG